jgi:hypothetical protein
VFSAPKSEYVRKLVAALRTQHPDLSRDPALYTTTP